MISLHVDLLLKPGSGLALEKTFHEAFHPAISLQPGFSRVDLLASRSEEDRYRLVIEFESEELRLKWVATHLHKMVWPKMEAHFINYTLKGFTVV